MDHKVEQKWTTTLLLSTFLCCFGSSMLYGYGNAVLNNPDKIINEWYNSTYLRRQMGNDFNESILDENSTCAEYSCLKTDTTFLWSFTVSIYVAAGMIGAFSSKYVADLLGRKRGLIFNHIFAILGGVCGGFTTHTQLPELLIVARFFIGLNCGMTIGLASVYLVEIAAKEVRGLLGACHQLAVTIGILLAMALGLPEILGTKESWPYLVAITALPAILSLVCLPFFPESPRYLLLQKKDERACREALMRLRGTENISDEMDEMRKEERSEVASSKKFTIGQLFSSKELRLPTIIAIVLQVAQQWSGINAVIQYSSRIFASANVPENNIPYANLGIGCVNVFCTIVGLPLIERLGRRSLLKWPTILMASSMIMIMVVYTVQGGQEAGSHLFNTMAVLSIVGVMIYIIGFAVGLGPIPAVLTAEIFRQEPRPAALAIGQVANWFCNFTLMLTFPYLDKAMGVWVFLLFLIIVVSALVFIWILVPETKNKTFEEIARDLAIGKRQDRQQTTVLTDDAEGGELKPLARGDDEI